MPSLSLLEKKEKKETMPAPASLHPPSSSSSDDDLNNNKDHEDRSPLSPSSSHDAAGGSGIGSAVNKRLSSANGGRSATGRAAAAASTFNVEPTSPSPSVLPADLDRRLDRHLLPALCCLSIVNYIDRTNLAFAASGLKSDVGITLSQYGEFFFPLLFNKNEKL